MNDDSLCAVWMSDTPSDTQNFTAAVNAVLEEDRSALDKERRTRIACVLVVALLCPALLWCAAYGKTPLVRGGYALMATGTALMVFAEWTYLAWWRQALPGAANARWQLQRTTFLLSRQANLIRTAPVWTAPIFIGTALIATWLYQERSHPEAYLVWALVGTAWLITSLTGLTKGAALDKRRSRVEQLLGDLGESD